MTPHQRLSHNPLFALEARRVRWGGSAKAMTDYSIVLAGAICVVVVLLWLVIRLSERYPARVNDFSLILLGASLLAALLLDYRCIATALGSINGEIAANRWDLLRLTEINPRQIVAAKFGAAQVRVWRLMMLITALRIAVALTLGISVLGIAWQDTTAGVRTTGEIISSLLGQLVLIVVAVIYVVEPFYRMRVVTALGVAISARARSHVSSVLVGVGALAALWLAQGIVITAMAFAVSAILLPLALVEYSVNSLIFCAPSVFLVILVATFYGFYSAVQAWSLRYAERWVARSG
ncbi:MAG: hypothetical protein U0521_24750 [Anaerolineae bacterium]